MPICLPYRRAGTPLTENWAGADTGHHALWAA